MWPFSKKQRAKQPARKPAPDPTARFHRVTYTFPPIKYPMYDNCVNQLTFSALQIENITINQF